MYRVARKEDSPQNVPKLRPIKNFWVSLIRKIYSNNYRPKDVKCLMAKTKKELKSFENYGNSGKTRDAHKLAVTFFFLLVVISLIINEVL
jgi:hypothetical protein